MRCSAHTMPAADFCTAFVRLPARAVQFGSKDPQGTRCRSLEVSSTTFRTLPPEFTSDVLDGYALRGNLPAGPPPAASYPVLVHWLVRLLALPSDPISRWQPLRVAILHLHQVGARTFTSPAVEHARHTGTRAACRLTPPLTAARRCGVLAIMQSRSRLLQCAAICILAEEECLSNAVTSLRLRRPFWRAEWRTGRTGTFQTCREFRAPFEAVDLIEVKVRGFPSGPRAKCFMPHQRPNI